MSANGVLHLSGPQRTARVRLVPSFATALLDGHFEHSLKRDSCCALRVDAPCFDELGVIFCKLLNNFKKLANAFLFCQGNRPLRVEVSDLLQLSTGQAVAFLTFTTPSLQYAPVWRVGHVEEKFLISGA